MTADTPIAVPTVAEQPEHRCDRRRFLIWACMAGLVQPERVSERILQELAQSNPEPAT